MKETNEENDIEMTSKQYKNDDDIGNENELILLDKKIKDDDNQKEKIDSFYIEVKEDKEIRPSIKRNFTPFKDDPYLDSNILSRFLMYWAYKIIKIATKTEMKKEYLGKIGEKHDSKNFYDQLSYVWETKGYKNIKKYSLILCVFRANIMMIFFVFFLSLIKAGTNYLSIILIKVFIESFDENSAKDSFIYSLNLWYLGLLFIGSQIIGAFLDIQCSMIQGIFGNKAQFQLDCFIYHKVLKCSPSSFSQRATEGEIINFVQFDAGKFNWMLIRSPSLLLHPIQIIAYSYLVFAFFGKAFIPGIFIILLYCFLGYKTSRYFHKFQVNMMKKKDRRMRAMTEIFDNIKILKLYNWENEFLRKSLIARRDEMDAMSYVFRIFVITCFLFCSCPCILSCLTLGLYQYFNTNISISTMLIGLSLFQRLQEPINQLPCVVSDFVEAFVSLTRIENYIKQPNIVESNIHNSKYQINGEYAIKITNGNFSWGVKQHEEKGQNKNNEKENNDENKDIDIRIEKENEIDSHRNTKNRINELNQPLVIKSERDTTIEQKEEKEEIDENEPKEFIRDGCKIQIPVPKGIEYDITLKNINLLVKPGEVLGIIGEVGSGKSSLLQAILNCLILLNPKECD